MKTAWVPYAGDGRCERCPLSATQALVGLHSSGIYAEVLILAACDEHYPELARVGARHTTHAEARKRTRKERRDE